MTSEWKESGDHQLLGSTAESTQAPESFLVFFQKAVLIGVPLIDMKGTRRGHQLNELV